MTNKELLKKIEVLEKEVERLKNQQPIIIVQRNYPINPFQQPYIIPQYPQYEYPIKWEITCSTK